MSRRESLFYILPLFNSFSSPPEIAEVLQCQQKEGKGHKECPLSQRAESRTIRILSTTFYSSNASNKHCSHKCLMCLVDLSTQQDTDSMNIPFFLTNPWHLGACWREKKQCCLYWLSPVHQTLVSPVPTHSSKGEHIP